MTEDKRILGLTFGCLSDPLSEQLEKQGFKYSKERVETFQKEIDAINTLRFGSNLMTDSMKDKMVAKLYKTIVTHIAKANQLKRAAQ